jgi:steroid delta-isomerase-like uncharacterized protein
MTGPAGQVAIAYFTALSNGDVDGAMALLADGADFRSPVGRVRGGDAIRGFLAGFDTAFPDAHFDLEHVVEAGGRVAVEGVYQGTQDGPLGLPDGGSLPATGRRVHAPFVTMFDIADGRITSHRPYWDMAGFMAQLAG